MHVELSEVIKALKVLIADMHYELITHKIAVDILGREKEDLQRQLIDMQTEFNRLRNPDKPVPPGE